MWMLLLLSRRGVLRNANPQKLAKNEGAQGKEQQSPENIARMHVKDEKNSPNGAAEPDEDSRGIVDFQPRLT
jgi:hypothetical protein